MMPLRSFAIPELSLAAPDAAAVMQHACTHIGMFYVRDHEVPAELIAAHFAFARSFFALDAADKAAIDVSRSNAFRGYSGYRSQTIDASAPGDCKEGFTVGPDLPSDHPHVIAGYPNTGSNMWPMQIAGFREHVEAYVVAMNGVGRRLAATLARSLDLPPAYFAAALHEPLTYTQLFRYPSVPAAADGKLGAGAHVDWGLFTILLQDDVGGLEAATGDGRWQPVAPRRGTFVVIAGEMMLRLTNGRYRSALHRVAKNTSGTARYSMPTFFDLPYDYEAACVPTCLPARGVARFPAVTVADHMREMAHKPLSAA